MKKSILIISILCAASAAWATLVTDDFNRDLVDYTTDTSLIGPHWKQRGTSNKWQLNPGTIYTDIQVKEAIMYNDELAMTSGGGDSFDFSLDVAGRHGDAVWLGVAFNYQDENNFYVIRYKNTGDDFQILATTTGGASWELFGGGHAGENFVNDAYYTINVASTVPHQFSYSIRKADNTLVASGNDTDSNSRFTGGYAGFYQSQTGGADAKFDNFSLEVIPEPSTLGLVGVFAAGALFIRRRLML